VTATADGARLDGITRLAASMGYHVSPDQAAAIDARALEEIRRRFGHLITPPLTLSPDVRRRISDAFNPS
jgi:hypothetical protein